MSYIWEEYSKDKIFYVGKYICPYIEVLNKNKTHVEVNPLIRFPEIFNVDALKFDNNCDVQNVIFHYLAQLDKVKGLNYLQCIIEKLRNEVESGFWGDKVSNLWKMVSSVNQDVILFFLAKRFLNDNQTYFIEVIGKLFTEASLIYESKLNQHYLYVNSEENFYNHNLISIIITIFWNIKDKLQIFWKDHYGIIESYDTMRIGGIQIA